LPTPSRHLANSAHHFHLSILEPKRKLPTLCRDTSTVSLLDNACTPPRNALYPGGVLQAEGRHRALLGIGYRDSRAQTRTLHPRVQGLLREGRLARAIKLRLPRHSGEIFDKRSGGYENRGLVDLQPWIPGSWRPQHWASDPRWRMIGSIDMAESTLDRTRISICWNLCR
jgi:hypothetical protein